MQLQSTGILSYNCRIQNTPLYSSLSSKNRLSKSDSISVEMINNINNINNFVKLHIRGRTHNILVHKPQKDFDNICSRIHEFWSYFWREGAVEKNTLDYYITCRTFVYYITCRTFVYYITCRTFVY